MQHRPRINKGGELIRPERASRDLRHALAQKRGCVPGKPLLIGPSRVFPQVARFHDIGREYASGDPCHRLAQKRGCVPGEAAVDTPLKQG